MPVNLTPRQYRALSQPVPDDGEAAPKVKRPRQKRVYPPCAICEKPVTGGECGGSYHIPIYGVWQAYHLDCFHRGRP